MWRRAKPVYLLEEQTSLLIDVIELHMQGLEHSIAEMTSDRTIDTADGLTELCGEAAVEVQHLKRIVLLLEGRRRNERNNR